MKYPTWREQVQLEQGSLSFIHLYNLEYEIEGQSNASAGGIRVYKDHKYFDVRNMSTMQTLTNLTEDQVDQALTDLGISNSGWVRPGNPLFQMIKQAPFACSPR